MHSTTQRVAQRARRDQLVVESIAFRKTLAGHNELHHHHVIDHPALARLLMLIDDHTDIEALVPHVRASELPALVNELLSLGLIEPVPETGAVAVVDNRETLEARSALSPMQFESMRRTAMNGATELLGEFARPHLQKLNCCIDTSDLRLVLDGIIRHIARTIGDNVAQFFVESVRRAAKR
jgi:hypothetical protein